LRPGFFVADSQKNYFARLLAAVGLLKGALNGSRLGLRLGFVKSRRID
jgi:hypothetical protein